MGERHGREGVHDHETVPGLDLLPEVFAADVNQRGGDGSSLPEAGRGVTTTKVAA
jgi:hypothetical protein